MNTVARKRYPMIDICKFLCALLIVALHTKPFNTVFALDQGLAVLERFAVPFFFCATGFFLLDGNGKLSGNRMKKQIIRLCSMAVIWQAIYIPVCNPEILGGGIWKILFSTLVRGINHYWFLLAEIQGIIILLIICRLKPSVKLAKVLLYVGALSYIAITVWNTYISKDTSFIVNNVFTYGLPFLCLGVLIGKMVQSDGMKGGTLKYGLLFVGMVMCLAVEGVVATLILDVANRSFFLFTLPGTAVLFLFTISAFKQEDKLAVIVEKTRIRDMSTLIYLTHGMVMITLERIAELGEGTALFFGVLAIDIPLCILIDRLLHKTKIRKYIY